MAPRTVATVALALALPLALWTTAVAAADSVDIQVTKAVDGCTRKAADGDAISVHYAGKLEDGTPFDSSYDRGSPFDLTLGAGMVIPGWEQGLQGMCAGEKRTLTIPYSLAYGEAGMGPIPPKATLVFDVEMMNIAGDGAGGASEDL